MHGRYFPPVMLILNKKVCSLYIRFEVFPEVFHTKTHGTFLIYTKFGKSPLAIQYKNTDTSHHLNKPQGYLLRVLSSCNLYQNQIRHSPPRLSPFSQLHCFLTWMPHSCRLLIDNQCWLQPNKTQYCIRKGLISVGWYFSIWHMLGT